GDGQGEAAPGTVRLQRPLVVPGTKEAEDLAGEITAKQAVYLVQAPDDRTVDLAEALAPPEPLEVLAGAATRVPHLFGEHIHVESSGTAPPTGSSFSTALSGFGGFLKALAICVTRRSSSPGISQSAYSSGSRMAPSGSGSGSVNPTRTGSRRGLPCCPWAASWA